MANGRFILGKQSGGTLGLVFPDGVSNTEVVLPESGELVTKDYVDTKQSKSELAYDVNTSSYIPNTLSSGAIIESGSNANGEYIKYSDGTMICRIVRLMSQNNSTHGTTTWTFPHAYVNNAIVVNATTNGSSGQYTNFYITNASTTTSSVTFTQSNSASLAGYFITSIGRWK